MNSKVANLIAVELGILIAIMAWLAFSNLRPSPSIEEPDRTVGSFATVGPVLRSTNHRRPPVDYRADLPAGQLQVEEPAQVVQGYDQAEAAPYGSAGLQGGVFSESEPYYAEVGPLPEPVLDDCLYSPLDQYAYSQPSTIIVLSNSRSSVNRPRFRPRSGRMMVAHRRPMPGQPHVRGSRIAPRPRTPVQSSRPNPRLRPRVHP